MPGKFSYDWPRPSVSVDCALFTLAGKERKVLLIQRRLEPFAGHWALPGGFVEEQEDLQAAAERELLEETGIDSVRLTQVAAVGTPHRDPRGHTITILYAAEVPPDIALRAASDAAEVQWFSVGNLPALAFDHQQLVERAGEHLASG